MAQLTVRLPDELREALRVAAALHGLSMEAAARDAIWAYVLRVAKGPKGASLAALLDRPAAKRAAR